MTGSLFLAPFYLSLVLILQAICSQPTFPWGRLMQKEPFQKTFQFKTGLEFTLASTFQFHVPPCSLPCSLHISVPPGTPIPPPLPFASLQTLPYSSRVVKRWSNNSHVTLFALSWFGNHHWPACEEVWGSLPCCLEVSLHGRVALVVPAAGTASHRGGMGCIPYSSYFTMSRNLGTPNVSKLQLFFSLRIIIHISDKFAPILCILKQI